MIKALEIVMVNLGSISEKKTLITVFPPISVFFDCIPITVCPIYSLTAGVILFKNCEFGFFSSHLVS